MLYNRIKGLVRLEFVEAIKYIIMGIIQGVTEVLPISSSGHVEIVKNLLNPHANESLLFLILVNTGSLLAFLLFYRRKIMVLVRGFCLFLFKKDRSESVLENMRFIIKLVLASIPAAIVGIFLRSVFDRLILDYTTLIAGVGLLFTGTVLMAVRGRKHLFGDGHVSTKDSILIGLAQVLALFPGVSRSGMTTSMALKQEVRLDRALDFSFMLYIPISIGSLIFTFYDFAKEGFTISSGAYPLYYFLAFIFAFFGSLVAFRYVFNMFKNGKLTHFAVYCLVIGTFGILLFLI